MSNPFGVNTYLIVSTILMLIALFVWKYYEYVM